MAARTLDILAILRVLAAHDVEFIVVGGVSAALNGAPIATYDLDVVHSRTPANIERLLAALEQLDAHSRMHPGRIVRPESSHLASEGHVLLMTKSGALDLLGAIGKGRGYEQLRPHAALKEVASGLLVHVLDLAKLIEIKQETGRDKDNAALPILKATLEERSRREPAPGGDPPDR